MCGATGTCISLVIVGAIIAKYGSSLVDHSTAGWAGIAFIYIYDINFSYSFGMSLTLLLIYFGSQNSVEMLVFNLNILLVGEVCF